MKRAFACLVFAVAACSSSSAETTAPGASDSSPAPPAPGESQASKEKPKDPATQLAIGVDAEDFSAAGFNLTAVDVVVTVDGVRAAQESVGGSLPHEIRVAAPKEHPDAEVVVDVAAKMNDQLVVGRRARTKFVPNTTKLAFVKLEVRCNTFPLLGGGNVGGPTCDAPTTCIGGTCQSDLLTDLPDYRADWKTSPPSACGAGTSATLEVGQGEKARAPLADGDTVAVECGPQGGHHVWLSLGMKDLPQYGTITTLAATQPAGGKSVPPTAYAYGWSPSSGGACELLGLRFQLDVGGNSIEDFLGKPLDLTISAKDRAGHEAVVLRHVQVAKDRVGDFCRPLTR